jgi:hypothetical protein
VQDDRRGTLPSVNDRHMHDHRHDWSEDAVLDIGGGYGALILHTDAEFLDREVEISPVGEDEERTHTAIHQRRIDGRPAYSGVYPALRAGEYRVWTDDPSLPDRVTIVDGEVAELDWRRG